VEALLAWVIERLGPRAVNRTSNLVATALALSTAAFAIVLLLVVLSR
jgi:hypothetical protein